MPSPVGHSLASIAVGWAVNRPARLTRALLIQSATLAAIGIAPDLDLLWGRHSRETHSVGAALLVASIAAWQRWPIGSDSRIRIFVAAFLAWFIHPVMDTFAVDHAPPVGVMLWWPFSAVFVHSLHTVFLPIARLWSSMDTWRHDAVAAVVETAYIGPVVWLIWRCRRIPRIGR